MLCPFTREGLETRIAIRAAYEANPALTPAELRRQFSTVQQMIDSAMSKTAAEWRAMLDATPASNPRAEQSSGEPASRPVEESITMPGSEQGIIK